jgi:dimeric dUTPase (all-alpha-NTP-PPase superfamily)
MNINYKYLYEIQAGLKAHISKNHPERNDEDRSAKKFLALLVELGECANEERGFKFWSIDQNPRREKLLEEYVDGLHFILELGIDEGFMIYEVNAPLIQGNRIEYIFLYLFQAVLSFYENRMESIYEQLFFAYMYLGSNMGFTSEEIQAAYLEKNEKNHTRQQTGY